MFSSKTMIALGKILVLKSAPDKLLTIAALTIFKDLVKRAMMQIAKYFPV